MTSILILGQMPAIETQVRNVVGAGVITARPAATPQNLNDLHQALNGQRLPEVVIVGTDGDPRALVPLVRALTQEAMRGVVVVTPDLSFVGEGFRAGAADVIRPDAVMEDLRAALGRAVQHVQTAEALAASQQVAVPQMDPSQRGNVIVVCSPTGGTGKTLAAVNLAVGMAGIAPLSTVLVDADLQFGTVAAHLQLVPSVTMATLAGMNDTVAVKTALTKHSPSGMFVVPGADDPVQSDQIDPEAVAALVDTLAHVFPTVIVDTAPGFVGPNLDLLALADKLLVVTTLSVPALQSMQTYLGMIGQLPNRPEVRLLVNQNDPGVGLTLKDVEANLGIRPHMALKTTPALALSVNRGTPAMLGRHNDPMRKLMSPLVDMFHVVTEDARRAAGRNA